MSGGGGACCGGGSCAQGAPPAPSSSARDSLDASLGSTLFSRTYGKISVRAALGDAALVAVYVSASWCGPCRDFTPKLAAWFTSSAATKHIIVFASLDRDEKSFTDYFAKMPWSLALPYGQGESFASRFGVRGVPTLLVFTRDGTLITKDGVQGLLSGKDFPFVWGGDRIGRVVTLQNLKSAAHYNGADGVVVGATESSARFSVRLDDSGDIISVKADALGQHWSETIIGRRGKLSGLEKAPELNGADAVVVGADRERGRLSVQTVAEMQVVSVKRGCFVAV